MLGTTVDGGAGADGTGDTVVVPLVVVLAVAVVSDAVVVVMVVAVVGGIAVVAFVAGDVVGAVPRVVVGDEGPRSIDPVETPSAAVMVLHPASAMVTRTAVHERCRRRRSASSLQPVTQGTVPSALGPLPAPVGGGRRAGGRRLSVSSTDRR